MPMIPPKHATRGAFELCPTGPQVLVCCDILDHGIVAGQYGGKARDQHKISLRWQSQHKMRSTGKPYIVQKRYTFSLHEKADLRKDVNAWRGTPLTDEQAARFDLEVLLGKCVFANVVHVPKPRGIFAEVTSLMPVPRGMTKIAVESYKRVVDRKEGEEHHDRPPQQGDAFEGPETTDADTSFDAPADPEF